MLRDLRCITDGWLVRAQVLTPIQVATFAVHTYPRFPGADLAIGPATAVKCLLRGNKVFIDAFNEVLAAACLLWAPEPSACPPTFAPVTLLRRAAASGLVFGSSLFPICLAFC